MIENEKLLALKAFYLGHGIAERHAITPTAMGMIDAAISYLGPTKSTRNKLYLAFFYLLRAEVLRHGAETPVEERRHAQEICQTIRSNLYDYFLRVEDATQARKQIKGIYIEDEGIKRMESHWETNGSQSWLVRYDIASRELGINKQDLTTQEVFFLEKASLKDLLDSHEIPYSDVSK